MISEFLIIVYVPVFPGTKAHRLGRWLFLYAYGIPSLLKTLDSCTSISIFLKIVSVVNLPTFMHEISISSSHSLFGSIRFTNIAMFPSSKLLPSSVFQSIRFILILGVLYAYTVTRAIFINCPIEKPIFHSLVYF